MRRVRHPVAVYRLMVDQQAERLVPVPSVFHPIYGVVSDYVREVSLLYDSVIVHRNESRIIIFSLPRYNLPIIKTGRKALQMPFSYNSCLIPRLTEQLGEGLLRIVKHACRVVIKEISAGMLSGYHAGPARPAERIGDKTVRESYPVPRNPVQVRSFHVSRVIAAHHLGRMVIGHYEEDIVRLPRLFLRT